jgi:hypothetical protein
MLDQYSERITAKVIITGNSDYEFHEIPRNIPTSVRALFLQNSFISDNKFIFTIPIGIENFRLGVNGNPKYIRYRTPVENRQNRVLFGPFSLTHSVRQEVIEIFGESQPGWDLLNVRISPREYDTIASRYAFISAVRGNGVDTHRLWESLYRGLVPIVAEDNWWNSLSKLYPQVVTISKWQSAEVKKTLLSQRPTNFDPKTIATLWMPYWEKKISDFCCK